ncbi:MAG: hypothetical protein JST44_16845 [Cyanobacteria bacterium SZAS LIN-5]|nr:hypothetical protein [Cyanobacteria bacterium SZAS LIN-5]
MSLDKNELRIGELLTQAEILTQKDLDEAMKTARSTGLPIGRVLIMAGFLTEMEFQAAVQAQSLVRDNILPLETAIKALSYLADNEVSFDESLSAIGWSSTLDKESNKLGELLLDSHIVPREQLETAMKTSQATGLPLGRLLISLGTLSDELLATALNAQSLIRAGAITRAEATNGLVAAHRRQAPLDQQNNEPLRIRGPHRKSVRLGELLVGAGILTHLEVGQALKAGLIEQKWIGEALIEAGRLSEKLLSDALSIQEMVANETLTTQQAQNCLRELQQSGQKLEQVIARLEIAESEFKSQVRYHELMRVAGIIGQPEIDLVQQEIDKENAPSFRDAFNIAQVLLDKGIIDERTYYGSLRCFFLLAIGWLNMQQGIIALNLFHHRQCTFDEVLQELNWTVRTHVRVAGQLAS